MKKNIAFFIYSLAGGGAERVVSILLNELSDIYNITLILMNKTISYDIPYKKINILYLEDSSPNEHGIKKLLKIPYLGLKYRNICKRYNIDLSFAFMNRPVYISMLAKLFKLDIKFIISERSTPSEIYKKNNFQSLINKFLIKNLYPLSDFIVTNSYGNYNDLICNFNIKKEKMKVIYNPIDLEKIYSSLKEEINGFTFDKFTFISVGRLDSGKNHKMIIEAFSELNIQSNLIIIGKGPLEKELRNLIKKLNQEDRVFILGFKDNPHKYISKSSCFVFSSKYEGFPNVLLESLACSIPIISTNCKSGPGELLNLDYSYKKYNNIKIGKYGILIPVDDKKLLKESMQRIYLEKELRSNYINKSKDRIENFEKAKIVNDFINTIEFIVKS